MRNRRAKRESRERSVRERLEQVSSPKVGSVRSFRSVSVRSVPVSIVFRSVTVGSILIHTSGSSQLWKTEMQTKDEDVHRCRNRSHSRSHRYFRKRFHYLERLSRLADRKNINKNKTRSSKRERERETGLTTVRERWSECTIPDRVSRSNVGRSTASGKGSSKGRSESDEDESRETHVVVLREEE